MTIFACLFFSCAKTSAAFSSSSLGLDSSPVTRVRDIITRYCDTVLNSAPFSENHFNYNAQQSAFVHLLCRNFDDNSSPYFTKNDKEKDYFKRKSLKEL